MPNEFRLSRAALDRQQPMTWPELGQHDIRWAPRCELDKFGVWQNRCKLLGVFDRTPAGGYVARLAATRAVRSEWKC